MKTKIYFFIAVLCSTLFLNTNIYALGTMKEKVINALRTTEIARAKAFLDTYPITVTFATCERSAGEIHDFYSEGDYWWPNPKDPKAPYIHKDGQTNPANFVAHRHAMVRLSEIVATLTSAWLLTKDQVYVDKAMEHLNAWFVDPTTRMNPNMLYTQAIWGRNTGRGIGIIDAYHLVEVAHSVKLLEDKGAISAQQAEKIKNWFSQFLTWMISHKYGIKEMNAENNHGVCWAVTASSFAVLTGNNEVIDLCRKRFKEVLLPSQMADDGSLPRELARTKPYGYSLFTIDAFCNLAEILSTPEDNLWNFETPDGKTLKKGLQYIYPFIVDKTKWPYKKDIYIWDKWPVCQSSLIFSAFAYANEDYLNTYLQLPAYPIHEEVLRNVPVRHPLIWIMK